MFLGNLSTSHRNPLRARLLERLNLGIGRDAVPSDRHYQKGRQEDIAVDILQKSSGIPFDPEVIRAAVSARGKGRSKELPL
jgi:response regulator RpfG family c-di-GMP phosphodiesterase